MSSATASPNSPPAPIGTPSKPTSSTTSPPYITNPNTDPDERAKQTAAAQAKADRLLRTHGFQAYQAAQYHAQKESADALPFWQYMTSQDDAVRDSHSALNGLILPQDDPFWADHYPPWDWGCRCQVRAITQLERDNIAEAEKDLPPEKRHILTGPSLDRLHKGYLPARKGPGGGDVDIRSPARQGKENPFAWSPGDLRIPLSKLAESFDPEIFSLFKAWADNQILEPGEPRGRSATSLLDWLKGERLASDLGPGFIPKDSSIGPRKPLESLTHNARSKILDAERDLLPLNHEKALVFDPSGIVRVSQPGAPHGIIFRKEDMPKLKGSIISHNHTPTTPPSISDVLLACRAQAKELRIPTPAGIFSMQSPSGNFGPHGVSSLAAEWAKALPSIQKAGDNGAAIAHKAWNRIANKLGYNYSFQKWEAIHE